jgi:uncharacterized protein (TIGR03435 family)
LGAISTNTLVMSALHPISKLLLATSVFAIAQPAFEVASVRPTAPGSGGRSVDYGAGGRFTASGLPLSVLIQEAYGIRGFQLSGGPDWVRSDAFTINAKAETDASEAQIRVMPQELLADRFRLTLHRESKDLSVYLLVIGKNGSKLKEVKLDADTAGPGVRFRGLGRIAGIMATIPQLAAMLSDFRLNGASIVDRPVLDRTGLTGVYDFTLEWGAGEQSSDGTAVNPAGSSIFTAVQEQLGLKLEAQKMATEFFVIDRAEKPAEN